MDLLKGFVNSVVCMVLVGMCPFLIGFLIKYLWRPWTIYRALKIQGFNGPAPRFMIGNLLDIANMARQQMLTDMPSINHNIRNRVFPYFVKWSQIYGDNFIIWFGSEPRIVIKDSEVIQQLLSSKHLGDCGISAMVQKMQSIAFGKGLISVNGQQWSQQRRTVAPAFHVKKLKDSVEIMSTCTAQLVNEWNEIIAETTDKPCELELAYFMDRLTAENFMRVEFGMHYNTLGKEVYEDIGQLKELMIQNLRYLWLPGSRYIPTPINLEAWKRNRRLDRNLKHMIEERKDSGSYGDDLLGLMLSEIENVSAHNKNFSYTTRHVIDECKTFFLGGRDTTSGLLSWAMLLLSLHQDWQQKAREEAMAVCGNNNPNMDSLGKLITIGMILKETLRLYPPGGGIVRQTFEDIKLGNGFTIPKGVNVMVDILLMHRNPQYWGDDVNEFRPDRFRDGIAKATNNHPSAFIPFSSGPRVCIGQNFALLEAKLVMAMMLRSFKFSLSRRYRHAPMISVTLSPQHGIPIMVERIDCSGR